jgi:hypothetical protein
MPVHKNLIENGAISQLNPLNSSATGILPVPKKRVNSL